MVLKISYNTFFLEGSLKDKHQAMKTSFFRFCWGKVDMHRQEQCPLSFVFQGNSLHSLGLWNVLKYLEYVVHTKTNNIYLHAKVKIKMQMKKAQVIIENEDKELTFGLIVKNP